MAISRPKPLGHTTDIQTSLTTVSKVAKVESDNAILYQIPLHKFQQLLETQSIKFKVFLKFKSTTSAKSGRSEKKN